MAAPREPWHTVRTCYVPEEKPKSERTSAAELTRVLVGRRRPVPMPGFKGQKKKQSRNLDVGRRKSGFQASKPDALTKLEQGEPLWALEDEIHSPTHPGYQGTKPDSLFKLEQGEPPWIVEGAAHSQTCPGYSFRRRTYRSSECRKAKKNHTSLQVKIKIS
ncbi:hypothetical protein H8959_005638 [Pygathrix nigripes]